ncbi:MAG: type II toxin-antitoxin system Phd/YefM family antitoxin [Marmoricola sp.]
MDPVWQLQEAKQRFSELIRAVERDGPQVVSRHGKEVAIVIDIDEYRRLKPGAAEAVSFKEFLRSAPSFDDLHLERSTELVRAVDIE